MCYNAKRNSLFNLFFNLKLSYNGMKINEYYWHDGSLNNGELVYLSINFDGIMKYIIKYLYMYIKEN